MSTKSTFPAHSFPMTSAAETIVAGLLPASCTPKMDSEGWRRTSDHSSLDPDRKDVARPTVECLWASCKFFCSITDFHHMWYPLRNLHKGGGMAVSELRRATKIWGFEYVNSQDFRQLLEERDLPSRTFEKMKWNDVKVKHTCLCSPVQAFFLSKANRYIRGVKLWCVPTNALVNLIRDIFIRRGIHRFTHSSRARLESATQGIRYDAAFVICCLQFFQISIGQRMRVLNCV